MRGVVGSQANYRNIQFGIDNSKQTDQWRDEGRPGKSVFIHSIGGPRRRSVCGNGRGKDQR